MTGDILQDKNQKSSSEAPPEKKGNLLVFALVLFASAGLFLYILSQNIEFLFESYKTSGSLFVGLMIFYAFVVWPYLANKYHAQLKTKSFRARLPYALYTLGAFAICIGIPLLYGKLIADYLASQSLSQSLPMYVLFALAIVIKVLAGKKLKLSDNSSDSKTQKQAPEPQLPDRILGNLHYALFFTGIIVPQFFMKEFYPLFGIGLMTVLSLYFSLLFVYLAGVGPYLKKKYLPLFDQDSRKKVPFVFYNLAGFALCFIIPPIFGESLYDFLTLIELTPFLPSLLILPLPLVFMYLGRKKPEGGQASNNSFISDSDITEKTKATWMIILLAVVSIGIAIITAILVRPYM